MELENVIGRIPIGTYEVVDFGSGNGRLTVPLLKRGYKVTAIDVSEESHLELKELVKKLGYTVKTAGSLLKLKNIKAVVGCDILHHVDMETALRNIHKTLNRGGTIIFSEPNALNPVWYLYFILKGIIKYEKNIVYMSRWNIYKTLKKNGFKNIEVDGLGLFPRSIFRNKLICKINDRLGNLPFIKIFAYRYILRAQKTHE